MVLICQSRFNDIARTIPRSGTISTESIDIFLDQKCRPIVTELLTFLTHSPRDEFPSSAGLTLWTGFIAKRGPIA